MSTETPIAVSAEKAAELLGVSGKHLRTHYLRDGIPHLRIGGRVVFPLDALHAWANRPDRAEAAA